MTEAEWLASAEPMPMLEFLREKVTRSASGRRKLRLLACAAVRHFWDVMVDDWDRDVVLVAEGYADGKTDKVELAAAREAARNLRRRKSKFLKAVHAMIAPSKPTTKGPQLTWPAQLVGVPAAWDAATWTLRDCPETAWLLARDSGPYDTTKSPSHTAERRWDAGLVRDIFGNPFRRLTARATWLSSTVTALARQVYESRDFSPLPILADALQDAGCEDVELLAHCRGPGPHVRGCWVVDFALVKG